jgi:hypothetical protein
MKTYNTQKSLYTLAEIKINDAAYQSQKLTKAVRAKFAEIEEKIKVEKSSIEATYEWVSVMFGVDMKILEELDSQEVEDIYLDYQRDRRAVDLARREKEIESFEQDVKQLKKAQDVTKGIPSKNRKRSGNKK